MREITRVIVHCTATPAGRHHTVDEIRRWHTDPEPYGNGWSDIGYHAIVYLDGSVHAGRPEDRAGAHVAGHNHDSLGIVYVGGTDAAGAPKDTRTAEQKAGLEKQLQEWLERYPTIREISGHHDYDAGKACPSFDARAEYAHLLHAAADPINIVITDPVDVTAYKFPSIGTPIATISPSTSLRVIRELTVTWRECELPNGGKGWIHPNDLV